MMRGSFVVVLLTLACSAAMPGVAQPTGPYFTDVTSETGLGSAPGYRLSIADINGDGYPDLLIHTRSDWAGGNVVDNQNVYLNVEGDFWPGDPFSRKFIDYTATSNVRVNREGDGTGRHSDSGIFADVDNDGDLDLFTLAYIHDNYTLNEDTNDLLLNDGSGVFSLAPSSPFHSETIWNTAGAVFVEYDNDGKIDLYIGNWYMNGALTQDKLYQGGGDGAFTNVTSGSGIGSASTSIYGISAFDWNDDGYTDLFAPSYSWTVLGANSIHWRNDGDGTFTAVQGASGFNQFTGFLSTRASFGSMPRDFDNDGDQDFLELMTHGEGDGGVGGSGIHTTTAVNINDVFSWEFARVHNRADEDPDITHHGDHYAAWFDFDNDMRVDFALTESGYSNNRFYIFWQESDETFSPVTVASGVNGINTANLPPHNVLAADYDLDGDEDLFVGFANNLDGVQLWENIIGTSNNWVTIILEGGGGTNQANRSAIGAKVAVTAGGVTQTREVYAGNGHHGPQVPLALSFGLGAQAVVDDVTVRWPNASLSASNYTARPANRFLTIREACVAANDPLNLQVEKPDGDVLLTWDESTELVWDWNVYRDTQPDTATWGAAHSANIVDEDSDSEGIQHTDSGAAAAGTNYFYLITAVNDCGETPLR